MYQSRPLQQARNTLITLLDLSTSKLKRIKNDNIAPFLKNSSTCSIGLLHKICRINLSGNRALAAVLLFLQLFQRHIL